MKLKEFIVQDPDWHGEDWSKPIKAYDHEQAVEAWAEDHDARGDYDIINSGTGGPYKVKEVGSDEVKVFIVSAEARAHYSAVEKV